MEETTEKTTRRGLFFIGFAKVWFLGAGFLLQLFLPRKYMLDQAAFGVWTVVLAWVSGFNNVMITGTVQTVSYFSRLGKDAAEQAKKTALKMQMIFGWGSMWLLLLGAPLIAWFEQDSSYVFPLRIASLIVLFYSVYAIFVGAANGQQQFQKQAGLDILFSSLRVGLVLIGAFLTHSVIYSLSGFVFAAFLITLVSIFWIGWPKKGTADPIPLSQMLRYVSWLLLYLFALNQLMFVDVYLLKKMCTQFFAQAFHIPAVQAQSILKKPVDSLLGIYGAAQTIARLPYQLMIAATFVIFPVLSKKAKEQNQEQTRQYIAATLRYSLIGAVAMAIGLGARFSGTMTLFYEPQYATGSDALAFLLLAYVLFSILSVVGTILNSLGHLRWTALLSGITLLVTIGVVYLSISQRFTVPASVEDIAHHTRALYLAAQGLVIGFSIGLGLFLWFLWKKYQVCFSALSLLRVALACVPGLFLGWLWKAPGSLGLLGGKVGTLLCGTISGVLYIVVLFLTREISFREILTLRKSRSVEEGNGSLVDS